MLYPKSILLLSADHSAHVFIPSVKLGQCLDDATHRVWKSSLFGICRLHALLHSLECMCQGIGSRKKYKLYLYRPFGNSSYFSGHY